MANTDMDKLIAHAKGQGFVYQGSEIYDGLANTWDYGPLGVQLKNNIKQAWWKRFIQESPYNVGIDSAIFMNPKVWQASGHVGNFNDPLIDCKVCKTRHRADKLIEAYDPELHPDGWTPAEMMAFIKEHNIA
jgi:glycyl-tRNA synthetase